MGNSLSLRELGFMGNSLSLRERGFMGNSLSLRELGFMGNSLSLRERGFMGLRSSLNQWWALTLLRGSGPSCFKNISQAYNLFRCSSPQILFQLILILWSSFPVFFLYIFFLRTLEKLNDNELNCLK